MALLELTIPIDLDWRASDRLQLRIGTEEARGLSGGTPAGGSVVVEESPYRGATPGGIDSVPLDSEPLDTRGWPWGLDSGPLDAHPLDQAGPPPATLSHRYAPQDKCAVLPVGVSVEDEPGNVSTKRETFVQLDDAPLGVRDLDVEPTENTGEAKLTWTESDDV